MFQKGKNETTQQNIPSAHIIGHFRHDFRMKGLGSIDPDIEIHQLHQQGYCGKD